MATQEPRHLTRLEDLSGAELLELLDLAQRFKAKELPGELAGLTVGLLFFRGSLRTRTSFEVAVHQLGGHTVNLSASSDFWEVEDREGIVMDGRAPEHVRDAARVLSSYVDALAIRPAPEGRSWEVDRKDGVIQAWARHARVPVINMESALWHPLQALADLQTLRESFDQLQGKRLALSWVHSPQPASATVAHSLLLGALRMGMDVAVAHPPGLDLDAGVLSEAKSLAAERNAELATGLSLEEAAEGAHVVYARSWQSLQDYGNQTLAASRRARFSDWKIDDALLQRGESPRVMHAMPVRRNVEITDSVLDGPNCLVYEQAANRLHTQKALLALLSR